jgi:hypothetical protein
MVGLWEVIDCILLCLAVATSRRCGGPTVNSDGCSVSSEGLRKLLVARKSGSAGRQSGTLDLDLSNPGKRIVACGLI